MTSLSVRSFEQSFHRKEILVNDVWTVLYWLTEIGGYENGALPLCKHGVYAHRSLNATKHRFKDP